MKHNLPFLLMLSLPPCALLASETATQTTVRPEIIGIDDGAIQNAGCGAEIWRGGPHDGETRLVRYAVRVCNCSVNSMIRVKLYELLRDRWKSAPLTGEPLQALPKEGFRPYSHLLDQVTYLHPVVIRNCNVSNGTKSYINPTGYSAFDDRQAMDDFHRMYALIGFRYLFTAATITRQDSELAISVDWLNIGLTPTYDKWKIRYLIKGDTGKEIWTGSSTLDLRTVFPDEITPPGLATADTATTHTDRFTNVPKSGSLSLQIVDPAGVSPHMALSIKGRTEEGTYLLTAQSKKGLQ